MTITNNLIGETVFGFALLAPVYTNELEKENSFVNVTKNVGYDNSNPQPAPGPTLPSGI